MTDTLTGIGSAPAGNPDGGTGGAPNGSGAAPAATPQSPAPAAAAPPDNSEWLKTKGWLAEDGTVKTDEVLKGYASLEKHLGAINRVPDEKAKPEEWDAFHKKLGWPGEAKGYELVPPKDMPENLPYDQAFADRFKTWANEAKLPKAAAQSLHDAYVKQFASDVQAFEASLTAKAKTAHEALLKDWGEPASEGYIKNRDAAVRALRSDPKLASLETELKQAGLLTRDGNFTSPALANLLAAAGRSMQNDTFVGNGQGGAPNNPFDARSLNLTEQAQLVKKDPATARRLAAAAGWSSDKLRSVFGT